MIEVRAAVDSDRDAIWEIFGEVIAAGETYPLNQDITRDDALAYWFQRGAHVANAAFIVAKNTRGQEIGRAMSEHCLKEARRLGFRAMQSNFVVSTNESAVKLWQALAQNFEPTLRRDAPSGASGSREAGRLD